MPLRDFWLEHTHYFAKNPQKSAEIPVIYLTNPVAACYTYFIVKGMQSIRKGKSNDIG